MHSSLYHGFVTHRRTSPIEHSFRYPVTMAYVDLAEVPALRKGLRLFGTHRWGPACFLEKDHLQTTAESLDSEVRNWIEARTGKAAKGPIRLLTFLRSWGYYFSPLNLYYVFNGNDTEIELIVAEVSNTPWRETHRYLLKSDQYSDLTSVDCQHEKEFHVSPFMDMDVLYQWHCTMPEETLKVEIESQGSQKHFFSAHLVLTKHSLTDRELAKAFWRSPWATGRIVANIYLQALVLWWKRCPFFPHPNKRGTQSGAPTK